MTAFRTETNELLNDVERFAGRRLHYRAEISSLIDLSIVQGQQQVFRDTVFLAKFLWNSYNLMQRLGAHAGEHPKLATEFRESLEKFTTLIKTIIKEGPVALKDSFKATFLSMSQEAMKNLMDLSSDLSWLKNYMIDMKRPLL